MCAHNNLRNKNKNRNFSNFFSTKNNCHMRKSNVLALMIGQHTDLNDEVFD